MMKSLTAREVGDCEEASLGLPAMSRSRLSATQIGSFICVILLLPLTSANAACDHIRVLGALDAVIEVTLGDTLSIVEPGPNQRQLVRDASGLLSPFLCQAVTRTAFVERMFVGEAGWVTNYKPDLVNLSSSKQSYGEIYLDSKQRAIIAPNVRALATRTFIHEAAHAGNFLLQAHDGIDDTPDIESKLSGWIYGDNDWTAAAKSQAVEVIKSNRLHGGFEQEWARMHNAFVQGGGAKPYHGAGVTQKMSDNDIVLMGVMSSYGGDNVSDDISEMTAGVLALSAFSRSGVNASPNNAACRAMQAEPGPGIRPEVAAVFTKVGFLHSVGFITDKAFHECVGNLKIRGEGSGFFSHEAGRETRRYTQNPQGNIGKFNGKGPWIFSLEASGTIEVEGAGSRTGRVILTLELAPGSEDLQSVSFPRGLYPIGPGHSSNNAMYIYYNDGSGEVPAIEVFEAEVLVSRASHSLVEGSVFIKLLINHTELFKFPVPPEQERIITFRKEN